jgi:hypothetical protein
VFVTSSVISEYLNRQQAKKIHLIAMSSANSNNNAIAEVENGGVNNNNNNTIENNNIEMANNNNHNADVLISTYDNVNIELYDINSPNSNCDTSSNFYNSRINESNNYYNNNSSSLKNDIYQDLADCTNFTLKYTHSNSSEYNNADDVNIAYGANTHRGIF